MSMLLPHVRLKATMLCTYALTSSSRSFYHILGLMMSCHVTAMSRASSSSLKRTETQKKRNIKSRKIDKRKRKMFMSKAFHNRHAMHSCRVQGSKCIKCNDLHMSEHYCQFFWYCKANLKTNPAWLETKQSELCPYLFRYLNCKGDHQANLNLCSITKMNYSLICDIWTLGTLSKI